MMIEYADAQERKHALSKLKGIEDRVWVQVEGCARVYAIADEDLRQQHEVRLASFIYAWKDNTD